MKARLGTVVFLSILSAAFGFAVFLLVAADETPAPGLILMGVCGVALARYLTRNRPRTPEAADPHDIFPSANERDREIFEQELERRRRDESDKW